MKGTVKLVTIDTPVEGMQVVLGKHLFNELTYESNDLGQGWSVYNNGVGTEVYDMHELKQIVVEYEEMEKLDEKEITSKFYPSKITKRLPLYPLDWKWALYHIGEEIIFGEIDGMAIIIYAPPTPTYTEEEVKAAYEEGCRVASPFGNQGLSKFEKRNWENWWSKHKKE